MKPKSGVERQECEFEIEGIIKREERTYLSERDTLEAGEPFPLTGMNKHEYVEFSPCVRQQDTVLVDEGVPR